MLEAYERLIHDAIRGDHTLFTTAEGIETLWEKSTPLHREPGTGAVLLAGQLGAQRDPPADRPARLAAAVRAVLARPQRHGGVARSDGSDPRRRTTRAVVVVLDATEVDRAPGVGQRRHVTVPSGARPVEDGGGADAMPSCSTRSVASSPISTPTGGRASVSAMSVLMYSTPLVPQLVTMLAPSAAAATAWNGESGSSGTTGIALVHDALRSAFWCSVKFCDQPADGAQERHPRLVALRGDIQRRR